MTGTIAAAELGRIIDDAALFASRDSTLPMHPQAPEGCSNQGGGVGVIHRTVHKRTARRFLAAMAVGAVLAGVGLHAAGEAAAVPGQCGSAIVGGNGGGFCDYPPLADGSWYHCESVYVLGFGGTNCFYVRPVPVDVDPRGWTPA